jgi:CRISPR-associated protein (TIGR03986 family)
MPGTFGDVFKKAAEGNPEVMAIIKTVEGQQEQEAEKQAEQTALEEEYREYLLPGYKEVSVGGKRQVEEIPNVFVNPYTFFPIEDEAPYRKTRKRAFGSDGLTGILDCSLSVASFSALFIPNTTKIFKEGEHKGYDFFSNSDLSDEKRSLENVPEPDPVIPGSEIRGMVRSVYEQLTNSCLPVIDENNRPHKRSSLPKKAFILEWDATQEKWELREKPTVVKLGRWHDPNDYVIAPNNRVRVQPHVEWRGNKRVIDGYESGAIADFYQCFNIRRKEKHGRTGAEYAFEIERQTPGASGNYLLHVTGEMFQHNRRSDKHLTLFDKTSGTHVKYLDKDDPVLRRFEDVLTHYCDATARDESPDNARHAAAFYALYRNRYRQKKVILVYGDNFNGSNPTYLSPACITKEFFEKTIDDILAGQYEHNRCDGTEDKFCPACRLFGAIGSKFATGSRVRFADTYEYGEQAGDLEKPKFTIKTLPILSSPRISATEFYLERPSDDAKMWNYDYYVRDYKLRDIVSGGAIKLKGRKVYLHFPYKGQNNEKNKMNNTVRLLNKGEFKFKVYFDDITDRELSDLIFAIGGTEGRLQKLGHGKPIGLGSVEVKVESVTIQSYRLKHDDQGEVVGVQPQEVKTEATGWNDTTGDDADTQCQRRKRIILHHAKNLQEVAINGITLGNRVSYPKPREGEIGESNKTYEWFGLNRGGSRQVSSPTINENGVLHVMTLKDAQMLLQEVGES